MEMPCKAGVDFELLAQVQNLVPNTGPDREILVRDRHVHVPVGEHILALHVLQHLMLVVQKPRVVPE